jgi:hypothetical protein
MSGSFSVGGATVMSLIDFVSGISGEYIATASCFPAFEDCAIADKPADGPLALDSFVTASYGDIQDSGVTIFRGG